MPIQPNGHTGLRADEETRRAASVPLSVFMQENKERVFSARPTELTRRRGRISQADTPVRQQAPVRPPLVDVFIKTCQRWRLSEAQQITLLGYEGCEALGRELLAGRLLQPSQDVRDRTGYVLGISIGLGTLFNEAAEPERLWLNKPHSNLAGKSPLEFMLEGQMKNIMIVAAIVEQERGL